MRALAISVVAVLMVLGFCLDCKAEDTPTKRLNTSYESSVPAKSPQKVMAEGAAMEAAIETKNAVEEPRVWIPEKTITETISPADEFRTGPNVPEKGPVEVSIIVDSNRKKRKSNKLIIPAGAEDPYSQINIPNPVLPNEIPIPAPGVDPDLNKKINPVLPTDPELVKNDPRQNPPYTPAPGIVPVEITNPVLPTDPELVKNDPRQNPQVTGATMSVKVETKEEKVAEDEAVKQAVAKRQEQNRQEIRKRMGLAGDEPIE